MVVAGMGKSGLIGAKISATLSSLGRPSHILHPAEAVHGDLGRIRRGDIALLLSFSGETEEVVALASILRADEVPCIGISRDAGTFARTGVRRPTWPSATSPRPARCNSRPPRAPPRCSRSGTPSPSPPRGDVISTRTRSTATTPAACSGPGSARSSKCCDSGSATTSRWSPSHTPSRRRWWPPRRDRRAGAILLVDASGRLTGIFTDGDLRRLVNARRRRRARTAHLEVMTVNPRHLDAQSLVRDAVRLVRERRVDEIPVVDEGGAPVGIVDVQDLIAMKAVQE